METKEADSYSYSREDKHNDEAVFTDDEDGKEKEEKTEKDDEESSNITEMKRDLNEPAKSDNTETEDPTPSASDDGITETSSRTRPSKRYIPEHKKPDAALTFPEKLMNMMNFAVKHDSNKFCIAWLNDGKSFVIRNPDEFTRKVLPRYFKATKFASFTRKLYRWGFRQVNRGIGPDDPIIFGNEHFQRDNAELMVKMRSITAAGTRKAQTIEATHAEIEAGQNRPYEDIEEQRRRMLLETLMQQKTSGYMNGGGNGTDSLFGQSGFQPGLNLASALRPSLGLQQQPMIGNMKPFGLLDQFNNNNGNTNNAPNNALNLYMAHQQQQQQQQQQHQGGSGPGHLMDPSSGQLSLPQQQQQEPQGDVGSSIQHQLEQLQLQQQQLQQQQQQLQQQQHHQQQQYSTASTAEIVNAAINALRFAS